MVVNTSKCLNPVNGLVVVGSPGRTSSLNNLKHWTEWKD